MNPLKERAERDRLDAIERAKTTPWAMLRQRAHTVWRSRNPRSTPDEVDIKDVINEIVPELTAAWVWSVGEPTEPHHGATFDVYHVQYQGPTVGACEHQETAWEQGRAALLAWREWRRNGPGLVLKVEKVFVVRGEDGRPEIPGFYHRPHPDFDPFTGAGE